MQEQAQQLQLARGGSVNQMMEAVATTHGEKTVRRIMLHKLPTAGKMDKIGRIRDQGWTNLGQTARDSGKSAKWQPNALMCFLPHFSWTLCSFALDRVHFEGRWLIPIFPFFRCFYVTPKLDLQTIQRLRYEVK